MVANEIVRMSMSPSCLAKVLDRHMDILIDVLSQVRFELAFMALNPAIKVIAPWRLPEFIERFQ